MELISSHGRIQELLFFAELVSGFIASVVVVNWSRSVRTSRRCGGFLSTRFQPAVDQLADLLWISRSTATGNSC
jgi:hypothetical protein